MAFLSWCVVLGRVLTADNLKKRGIVVTKWCFMCKANVEDVNHLFLHYSVASDLWALIFCLFGVFWVIYIWEVFASWKEGWSGRGGSGRLWLAVLACLM